MEIGGATTFFGLKGGFPIYLFAERVDNVNYDVEAVFGNYNKGNTFNYYKNKTGNQFIADATELKGISNNSYDFLLSSHSLEHVANPIKALKEWKRVLKEDGKLILILPDKRFTFDFKREYTSFDHILNDFKVDMQESDTTHIEEILANYDEVKGKVKFSDYEVLVKNNYVNRCAHHHVYSQKVVKDLLGYVGFNVENQYEILPFHLITVASI